jgi:uncharacterized protein YndB with AHSA1/START domain
MTKSIYHKFFFQHSHEVVWEYLTKAELISQWLMENDFLPIIGYDFQFRTRPFPDLNFDGIVYCKVLEIIPFKKLSYSWKCGPGNNVITLDSIVVWTLHPKDNGTELFLEHIGFKEIENFAVHSIMDEGWLKNIQKIAGHINAAKHGTANT